MANKKKLPVTWIVLVRSAMDDTIIGAYPTLPQAKARQRVALADVDAVMKECRVTDASIHFGVAIMRARGSKVELWSQEDLDEQAEAA
jgi:hypothetical protein